MPISMRCACDRDQHDVHDSDSPTSSETRKDSFSKHHRHGILDAAHRSISVDWFCIEMCLHPVQTRSSSALSALLPAASRISRLPQRQKTGDVKHIINHIAVNVVGNVASRAPGKTNFHRVHSDGLQRAPSTTSKLVSSSATAHHHVSTPDEFYGSIIAQYHHTGMAVNIRLFRNRPVPKFFSPMMF